MSDLTEDEKKWVDNELVAAVKAKGPETPWRCAIDPKSKKFYFFNKTTKETTWQMPEELKVIESMLIEQVLKKRVVVPLETTSSSIVVPARPEEQRESKNVSDINQSETLTLKINSTKKVEPVHPVSQPKAAVAEERAAVVDEEPVEGEEEKLLELLSRKDSILEPDTIRNAQRLIKVYKQSPKMIIDKLAGTYSGYPQMCQILLDVLGFAQSLEGRAQASYEQPEKVAQDHFIDLARHRFNKKQADEILLRYSHTPFWLKDMIHNEDTRELLNELNMKHRDSKFLRLCTKEMNALGYGNKHSPLLIASELDHVHKFYSVFVHLIQKCLHGDERAIATLSEDLSLHCKADKTLLELCKYECHRLSQVIYNKDPTLAIEGDDAEPASKRMRMDQSTFLYPERLQRVHATVSKLLETCNQSRSSVGHRRALDINSMKSKVQSDALLQALVNIVESQQAGAQDMQVVLNKLGLNGENTSVSQSLFTGSYYWCSKQLVNILLDSYVSNALQTSLLQVIAASALMSDFLPHMLEDSCTLSTVPSTFQSTLEDLNLSFTFIRWRDTTQEDIVVNLPRVVELAKDISSMLYGAIDREKVDSLAALVSDQKVFAQCLLRLLTNKFARNSTKEHDQSVNTGNLVSIWAQMLQVIVTKYPMLNSDVLGCVEVMLDLVSKSAESDDLAMQSAKLISAADAKKDLLEVLVGVLKSDQAVEDACHYFMAHVDSFDAVTVRHVMHSFLIDVKLAYWLHYSGIFVDLLSVPAINRAISNAHFRKDAISNLRLVLDSLPHDSVQEVPKLQDLVKLVQEL